MKFASLFDYKYFVKSIESSIKDDTFKLKIKACKDNTIPDEDYFLLSDSVESFVSELKHYSKNKTFFKSLLVEELTDSNIPNLFALLTHFSIGLIDRRRVRDGVDLEHFNSLKKQVDGLINDLIKNQKAPNKLLSLLKD